MHRIPLDNGTLTLFPKAAEVRHGFFMHATSPRWAPPAPLAQE